MLESKIRISLVTALAALSMSCSQNAGTTDSHKQFLETQLQLMVSESDKHLDDSDGKASPRCLEKDGSLRLVAPYNWCSGFFPGVLWYMYEYTGNDFWMQKAKVYTERLEHVKKFDKIHDLGFMLYSCYGNGYRLTGDEKYKEVLIETAKTLSTRYNDKIGCIRSWDFGTWNYPVIVDNMINLELMFFATEVTGDSIYRNIAISHADNTLKNHFRPDFSSYHVVDYNNDGTVKSKGTHQGLNDESVWSRGQSWGAYGYTMCYRFTKDTRYLQQAENIIDYFFSISILPDDLIPYWDMADPKIPDTPRDVSAAAVFASALYELSGYVDAEKSAKYIGIADKIMDSLKKSYLCKKGESHGFILDHSTGNLPAGDEIDVPIIYAEYYYLEALNRRSKLAL